MLGHFGQIFHHGKVLKDKSRADAAADEGVAAEGLCCLPRVGGDGDDGVAAVGFRAEDVLLGGLDFRIDKDHFEWVAFVEMPGLVGANLVEATAFALLQEEKDSCQCRTVRPSVGGSDGEGGAKDLCIVPPFRVREHVQSMDEFLAACF